MADNSLSHTSESPEADNIVYDSEDLASFLSELFRDSRPEYAIFSFPVDAIDPLAYLEMCWDADSFQFYWEKPANEFAIAGADQLLNISASGTSRFKDISKRFNTIKKSVAEYSALSHPYSGMIFVGGFSFFDHINCKKWDSFQPASFTLPRWMLIKDGKFNLITLGVELEEFHSPDEVYNHLQQEFNKIKRTMNLHTNGKQHKSGKNTSNFSLSLNGAGRDEWISSVGKAKELISKQSFEKLVLARQASVSVNDDLAPTQVLNKLRQQYTNCYNFLIHQPSGKTFLGSTPERLAAFRNQLLLTEALAGSIHRGKTATEDTILEKNLSSSQKDQSEHNFVVKDIEERLKPFVNSINRSARPEIKKLANVQHLYTPIRAQLKQDTNLLDVVAQLHPTPAVGGYPWEDAAAFISELEDFDRGWYAGPVGWFNTSGDGEFAVSIRSGLFTPEKAHFFAGCGIVADSNPEAEWEETNLKLKPMLTALQYD